MRYYEFVASLILTGSCWSVFCQQSSFSEREIASQLLADYSPDWRPRKNATVPVDVTVGYDLFVVNDVLEKQQEIALTGCLNLMWVDEYLVWNNMPGFNETPILNFFSDEIWLPDIAHINSGDMYAFTMAGRRGLKVASDGNVTTSFCTQVISFCPLDITYFPFDSISCAILIESWVYGALLETLTPGHLGLSYYKENEQWTLYNQVVETFVDCYDDTPNFCYPAIQFRIFLRRKAAYYTIYILIPSLVIAFLELVVIFAVPPAIAVKISFTCLLSYTFFQRTISGFMPRTSDHLPLLSIYINMEMALIGFALIGEAIVSFCEYDVKNAKHIPELIFKVILESANIFLGRGVVKDIVRKAHREHRATIKAVPEELTNDVFPIPTMISLFASAALQFKSVFGFDTHVMEPKRVAKDDCDEISRPAQWMVLGRLLSRLICIIYVAIFTITPIVVFYILPKSNANANRIVDWRKGDT